MISLSQIMWLYIYMLPPEVVGQNVLAFLNLKSLVQLDTAIMDHMQKAEFLELLKYCPPVKIHQGIQVSKEELLWFRQRKCRIQEMKLSLSQSDYSDIDISVTERVLLDIKCTVVSSDIDKLKTSPISLMINSIHISGEQDNDLIYSLFSLVPNVKKLLVLYNRPYTWLESVQYFTTQMCSLSFVFDKLTHDITNLIHLQGKHLKYLYMLCTVTWEDDPNNFLEALGRECPFLEELHIENLYRDNKTVLQYGIMTLTNYCFSLQTLAIMSFCLTDTAIIAIAEHCTNLKRLELYETNLLTYTALITLSKHCLPHEVLSIPWIPIPSVEVAAQCAHALSRIQRLKPTPSMCTDVPSLYIGYLTSLETLDLSESLGESSIVDILTAVTLHCPQIHTVAVSCSTDVIVEHLIVLARSNSSLTSVNLRQATALTDASLIELAGYSTRLTGIRIKDSHLVTDTGITALVGILSKLSSINLNNCPRLSDVCVLALSEHCTLLESFILQQCDQLTEEAIVPLALSCRHLFNIMISPNNMSEVTMSLLLAQRSEQPTKYASLYISLL